MAEQQKPAGSTRKALEPWAPLNAGYWLAVPEFFLDYYHIMGLAPGAAMLVLHLLRHRMPDGRTCQTITSLADQMGVSYNQVRKYIAALKGNGYLVVTRETKGKPCVYDVAPLCKELERHRRRAEAEQLADLRRKGRYGRG